MIEDLITNRNRFDIAQKDISRQLLNQRKYDGKFRKIPFLVRFPKDQIDILYAIDFSIQINNDIIMNIYAPGGTGKSFLKSYLKTIYQDNVKLLAPTHIERT